MEFDAILGSEVSCACSGKRGNLEECDLFSPLFCCFLRVLKVGRRPAITKTKHQRNSSDFKVSHGENSDVSSGKRGVYLHWNGTIMETADSDLTGEKQSEGR